MFLPSHGKMNADPDPQPCKKCIRFNLTGSTGTGTYLILIKLNDSVI